MYPHSSCVILDKKKSIEIRSLGSMEFFIHVISWYVTLVIVLKIINIWWKLLKAFDLSIHLVYIFSWNYSALVLTESVCQLQWALALCLTAVNPDA